MLIAASKKYNIDLNASLMIGDRDKDIYAGLMPGPKQYFYQINLWERRIIYVEIMKI